MLYRVYDKSKNKYIDKNDGISIDVQGNVLEQCYIDDDINENLISEFSTGLTDKNGTEIFKGDIVKYDNYFYKNLIAVVEEQYGSYGIWDKIKENKKAPCFIFEPLRKYMFDYVVIGNIKENLELLIKE